MNRRKHVPALLLALILLALPSLAACSRNWDYTVVRIPVSDEAAQTPTDAPATTPTQPEWQPGLSRASYVEAVYTLLSKGEEVEIIGRFAHYWIISAEPCDLLVDENYVRMETENEITSYTAYARYNRPVYAGVYMREEPVAKLATNTVLTVLEEGKNWVYVQWSGGQGYMKTADISKFRIKTGSSNTPVDGTDVNVNDLCAAGQKAEVKLLGGYHPSEKYEKSRKGTVLAENVEACLTVFTQGAEIKVTAYDDESCTILLEDDLYAKIPRGLVLLDEDPEETCFSGFAVSGAVVYTEYQCRNACKTLKLNEAVNVLYKLPARSHADGEIYVVTVDDEMRYIPASSVSKTKISSSSGAANSDIWTPPAL